METTRGKLGFVIPVQTLNKSQHLNLTPADVTAWRNHLPMADLGNSAKQVYNALYDCNQVILDFKSRFEVLEIFRTPVQYICQSLRKHYINQPTPLQPQQLTIATLAQTLQLEMANGYKILLEQYGANPSLTDTKTIGTIIHRILYYYNNILFRSYNLYAAPPKNIWSESHLAFRFAEGKNLSSPENNIEDIYKQTLMLACAIPLKWRQSEQDGLHQAIPTWTHFVELRKDQKSTDEIGIFIVDLSQDLPAMSLSRGQIKPSDNTRYLNFAELVKHIKAVLAEVEPNELKARMAHSSEVEYGVTTPVLRGLLKEWGTRTIRQQERVAQEKTIKICLGLSATHYYLSQGKQFEQSGSGSDAGYGSLPTFGIQEDMLESVDANKAISYPTYLCKVERESPIGYLITCQEMQYLTVQPGELIGIQLQTGESGEAGPWELGMIRWLEQTSNTELKMGIHRLSEKVHSGKAQLIKEGQPAGYFLRCFVFDTNIITPPIPFRVGNQVSVQLLNSDISNFEVELTELIDVTSSFKLFHYVRKEEAQPEKIGAGTEASPTAAKAEAGKEAPKGGFEDIWSKL